MDNMLVSGTHDAARPSLLKHFETIIELSGETGLDEAFFKAAEPSLSEISAKLDLTPLQAALFALFLNRSEEHCIRASSLAESIKCNTIKIIQYMSEFDELVNKKLLICSRGTRSDFDIGSSSGISYRVPAEVINALRKDEAFVPPSNKNLSIDDFFTVVEELFEQRNDNELTFEMLTGELKTLINNNMQLVFCQKINNINMSDEDRTLLMRFFHLFANNHDDNIRSHDYCGIYDNKSMAKSIERSLKEGENWMMELQLVEYAHDNGFADRESFKMTDKAKAEFLEELNIKEHAGKKRKELIQSATLTEKKLFYNEKEERRIGELVSLLKEENFKTVQQRLSDKGMRTGFACLFSGPPGTGKTETAYQIARMTGRDIMLVDISETKSMWFGESEKLVKELFDRYRNYVKSGSLAPILLFNEADAVIGKRKELGASGGAVDQTENTIQNIILQEMETLSGILIATTNLTQNMDKAFERRFLYKIEFSKPNLEARKSIWQSMMPALAAGEAETLARDFNFSGGQIENIARKRVVDSVISGIEPSLDNLVSFCQEELLAKPDGGKKIGFTL